MAYSWGRTRDIGDEAHERMYPGHREAAREYGGGGLLGLLSGRNKDFVNSNKDRMRAIGIEPSHRDREGNLTGRYSSGDWKDLQNALDGTVTTGLGPENRPVATPIGDPSLWGDSPQRRLGSQRANIREWGTQNPNQPGSMALDPTWAGGLRGAGLGAEMTQGDRISSDRGTYLHPDFMARATPGEIDYELSVARGEVPYDKSGRMGLGAARRARRERAMRNMSERDRQEAGFSGYQRMGNYSEWDRISRAFDERMARMKGKLRDWDIEDRTSRPGIMGGGPSTRIHPDWSDLSDALSRIGREEDIGRDGGDR